MSVNALIAAAASLQRLDGVTGVLLFKNQNVLLRQTPFSRDRDHELCGILDQMLGGYRQVNRRMAQICLDFEHGSLLLIIQEQGVLASLLSPRADPDLIATAAAALMHEHSAVLASLSSSAVNPVEPSNGVEELVATTARRVQEVTEKAGQVVGQWSQARKAVEAVLGKVMGRAQMDHLITRTLSEVLQTSDPYRLTAPQVRQAAVTVVEQIPNASKRTQLLAELKSRLAELNL